MELDSRRWNAVGARYKTETTQNILLTTSFETAFLTIGCISLPPKRGFDNLVQTGGAATNLQSKLIESRRETDVAGSLSEMQLRGV
ncbi:hypothetical protein RSOLAG1IB_02747 [Rhizoctonia solani AG-1 IB]|uniref:Uncharacterized protein n=1 Tax=Thanatephorus cucumeris (strain AG1-IB / isolate 7/3/14) TaxID=1108050 RepID=A0A0B7FPB4_THACB|nr:hypothetical protein RSOLAG1IB_02747 [Rhizoctonia solani AG-1 IB]